MLTQGKSIVLVKMWGLGDFVMIDSDVGFFL